MKILDLLQLRGGAFPASRGQKGGMPCRLLFCHRALVARSHCRKTGWQEGKKTGRYQ